MPRLLLAAFAACVITACGGGGSAETPSPSPQPSPSNAPSPEPTPEPTPTPLTPDEAYQKALENPGGESVRADFEEAYAALVHERLGEDRSLGTLTIESFTRLFPRYIGHDIVLPPKNNSDLWADLSNTAESGDLEWMDFAGQYYCEDELYQTFEGVVNPNRDAILSFEMDFCVDEYIRHRIYFRYQGPGHMYIVYDEGKYQRRSSLFYNDVWMKHPSINYVFHGWEEQRYENTETHRNTYYDEYFVAQSLGENDYYLHDITYHYNMQNEPPTRDIYLSGLIGSLSKGYFEVETTVPMNSVVTPYRGRMEFSGETATAAFEFFDDDRGRLLWDADGDGEFESGALFQSIKDAFSIRADAPILVPIEETYFPPEVELHSLEVYESSGKDTIYAAITVHDPDNADDQVSLVFRWYEGGNLIAETSGRGLGEEYYTHANSVSLIIEANDQRHTSFSEERWVREFR